MQSIFINTCYSISLMYRHIHLYLSISIHKCTLACTHECIYALYILLYIIPVYVYFLSEHPRTHPHLSQTFLYYAHCYTHPQHIVCPESLSLDFGTITYTVP